MQSTVGSGRYLYLKEVLSMLYVNLGFSLNSLILWIMSKDISPTALHQFSSKTALEISLLLLLRWGFIQTVAYLLHSYVLPVQLKSYWSLTKYIPKVCLQACGKTSKISHKFLTTNGLVQFIPQSRVSFVSLHAEDASELQNPSTWYWRTGTMRFQLWRF